MKPEHCVRKGHSSNTDAVDAVDDIWRQTYQRDASLTAFFCSYHYDLDKLATRIRERFGDSNVVGCTTAGEVGALGYVDRSISAFSLSAPDFHVATGIIDNLHAFKPQVGRDIASKLLDELSSKGHPVTSNNTFAFQFMDPLSKREEVVTHTLCCALGGIPMFGGSAGDDLLFKTPMIFYRGGFRTNASLINVISTNRRFELLCTNSFVEGKQRLVITAADPSVRIVTEINGGPAAEEYAEAVGVEPTQLSQQIMAANPVLLRVHGELHARGLHAIHPDGSIEFGSAIDQGIVLTIGKQVNIVDGLTRVFDDIRTRIKEPTLTIVCDCIHRRLEVLREGCQQKVGDTLCKQNAVGYCTYGEQFGALANGYTLVGVAIDSRS